eukprot:CAMPEP_0179622194 /NCGR_PEP_ID=MMETSP0932-20121108/1585_1 /TAXON_ID=548131 ORGANISM="Ostreococcus mediterraneus, Strain clade-D-RCC2596" /NCGR_SAMPLE_ID=MMETSP0932 /ASSEMBLY_ACC=CAM_ASM_000582 /LENGTH=61 /DNA_ID=CAMNT_0021491273 /DNA_START=109 /DNA_END=294 /DNA_ORIENTATION=-
MYRGQFLLPLANNATVGFSMSFPYGGGTSLCVASTYAISNAPFAVALPWNISRTPPKADAK